MCIQVRNSYPPQIQLWRRLGHVEGGTRSRGGVHPSGLASGTRNWLMSNILCFLGVPAGGSSVSTFSATHQHRRPPYTSRRNFPFTLNLFTTPLPFLSMRCTIHADIVHVYNDTLCKCSSFHEFYRKPVDIARSERQLASRHIHPLKCYRAHAYYEIQ